MSNSLWVPATFYRAKELGAAAARMGTSADGELFALATQGPESSIWLGSPGNWLHEVDRLEGSALAIAAFAGSECTGVRVVTTAGPFFIDRTKGIRKSYGVEPAGQWAISPGGRLMARFNSGKLQVIEGIESLTIRGSVAVSFPVVQVAFSRESRRVAVLGAKGQLNAWDLESNEQVCALIAAGLRLMAIGTARNLVVGVKNAVGLVVFDGTTGKALRTIDCPLADKIESLELSPDGDIAIAVGEARIEGRTVRAVRLFDLSDGRELAPLAAHDGQVAVAALGRRFLVTAGSDGKLIEWDWEPTLGHLRFHTGLRGDHAEACERARRELLSREKDGLTMKDIWALGSERCLGQIEFEVSDEDQDDWREVFVGRREPRPFPLQLHAPGRFFDICGLHLCYGLVVSQKVVDLLKAKGLTGWKTFPVNLELDDGPEPPCPYYGLAATGKIGASHKHLLDSGADARLFVDVYQWDGSDFFAAGGHGQMLVTSKVLDVLDSAGISGWDGQTLSTDRGERRERHAPLPPRADFEPAPESGPEPPALVGEAKVAPQVRGVVEMLDAIAEEYADEDSEEDGRPLSENMDAIEASARPAVRLKFVPPGPGALAVGATRFGGRPDLPPDVPWPAIGDRPQAFLGQIRAADFKPYDPQDLLPDSGLLSFFLLPYAEPHWDIWVVVNYAAWTVLYTPEGAPLERRGPPEKLPSTWEFPARGLTVQPIITLPDKYTWKHSEWSLDDEASDDYDSIRDALTPDDDRPRHQLLGWPNTQQGCIFEEAARGKLPGAPEAPAGWQMLLQLDSDPEFGPMWGDDGMLYFCVPSADLRSGDCSRAWCTAQGG